VSDLSNASWADGWQSIADSLERRGSTGTQHHWITAPDSHEADLFFEAMISAFDPEECDARGTINAGIRSPHDPALFSHAFYQCLVNDEGRAVLILNWDLFPVAVEEIPDAAVICIGFIWTAPSLRHRSLTRHPYGQMIRRAIEDAQSRGLRLIGIGTESVAAAESHFWKALDMRRIYRMASVAPRTFEEFPYAQPPLDFDVDGNIAEGAGIAWEHYMLLLPEFDDTQIPASLLMSIIEGTVKAYAGLDAPGVPPRQNDYLRGLVRQMQESLGDVKAVSLISPVERQELRDRGVHFVDHTRAD
jgi:hypothetical protein